MQCCVLNCKNNSTVLQSAGIGYHALPSEQSLRAAWLRALSKQQWTPSQHAVVCSDHFAAEDLSLTDGGCLRVRAGAVPRANRTVEIIVEQSTTNSTDSGDVCRVQVCHVCLATNTKLYSLRDYKLDGLYEQLTGLSMTSKELSIQLCPLCTRRLTNHARFRECARAAQRLLTDVLRQRDELASQSMKSAEQTLSQLPPLTAHHKQNFDLNIVYIDIEPQVLQDMEVEIEKLPIEYGDGVIFLAHKPLNSFVQVKEEKDDLELLEEDYKEGNALEDDVRQFFLDFENALKDDSSDDTDKNDDVSLSSIDNMSDSSCDELEKAKNIKTQVSVKTANNVPTKKEKTREKKPPENKDLLDDAPLKVSSNETIDNELHFLAVDNALDSSCDEPKTPIEKENKITKVSAKAKANVAKEKKKRAKSVPKVAKSNNKTKPLVNEDPDVNEPLKDNSRETIDNDARFLPIANPSDFSCEEPKTEIKEENKIKKVSAKAERNVPKEKKKRKFKKYLYGEDGIIDWRRLVKEVLNPTLFTVTKLTLEDQLDIIDKRKESKNYKNSPHKCTECYKGFVDKAAYDRHMYRHSEQCGAFKCDVCKVRLKKRNVWRNHVSRAHWEQFECNSCSFTTQSRLLAVYHQRWHDGKKFQCPHCPASLEKITSYMSHVRINHPTDIACQLCGYSFMTQRGLMRHLNLTHLTNKQKLPTEGPRCEECDKIFATDEALDNHRKIQHFKSKRNAPLHAYTSIPRQRRKERNNPPLLSQSGKKGKRASKRSPTCNDCGESFQTIRRYRLHMLRTHGRKFSDLRVQCDVCGKTFSNKYILVAHMEVHDESVSYPCPECGKTYKTRTRLYCHRQIHSTTDRPACPLCPMTFSTSGNLKRHISYTHKTVRDVKCQYCPKKFKSIADLRQHQLYTHQQKPWPKRVRNRKAKSEA